LAKVCSPDAYRGPFPTESQPCPYMRKSQAKFRSHGARPGVAQLIQVALRGSHYGRLRGLRDDPLSVTPEDVVNSHVTKHGKADTQPAGEHTTSFGWPQVPPLRPREVSTKTMESMAFVVGIPVTKSSKAEIPVIPGITYEGSVGEDTTVSAVPHGCSTHHGRHTTDVRG